MTTAFIFGLGYVGVPLAHALAKRGWQIRGTTRNPSKFADKIELDWEILSFAADRPLAEPHLAFADVDLVISTISTLGGSDPVLDLHGKDLDGFAGWTGYISATSVYPHKPNGICYEDTPVAPATARGKARVLAESRWQNQLSAEIFRAAGIYGPGRSPFDALRDGTARIIEQEGQMFNRIHVDDICRIINAAIDQPRLARIINLADQKPAPQGDVVRHAAALIGVAPPVPQKLEDTELSAMAQSFYVSRRRVGSRVIKPELGLDLLYPDYETGLASILAAEQQYRN